MTLGIAHLSPIAATYCGAGDTAVSQDLNLTVAFYLDIS